MQAKRSSYRPFGVFRLVLALMVAAQHYSWVAGPTLHHALERVLTGNIAVLSFFALSGFIITEAALRFYDGKPFSFAINRGLRLGPPFLLALAICIAVYAVLTHTGHSRVVVGRDLVAAPAGMFSAKNIAANVLAITPWVGNFLAKPGFLFIPYTWALRAEAWFYLAVAVGLLFSLRLGAARALLLVGVACGLGYLAFRFGWGGRSFLFRFVPFFAYGAVAYVAVTNRRLLTVLATAGLLALCLWDFQSYDAEAVAANAAAGMSYMAPVATRLLAVCLLAVPLLALRRASGRPRELDRQAGDLSYPLYLNHGAVLAALIALGAQSPLAFFGGIAASVALAWLAELATEPLLKPLRDRVRGTTLT